jgi:ribosomal-protein-alanine N-acetyltransferase
VLPRLPATLKMSSSPIPAPVQTAQLILRTSRLVLVAATLSLIETEMSGATNLAASLNAELESWPPPGNDESSLRWTLEKMQAHPEYAGFHVWYVILTEGERRTLIGMVAFKGPPDEDGTIEAGYSINEKYQRQGIATEATQAIMNWAYENPAVRVITAETFPELEASKKVMQRCGMVFLGDGSEPRAIRYGVTREAFSTFLQRDRCGEQ